MGDNPRRLVVLWRKEAALYAYWTMATARFDAARVLRLIASIIGIPGLVLTLLATPEHDLLRQKDILARGYGFSAARLYRYSEARRMSVVAGFRARDGKLVKRAGIVIDFVDGRRWSSPAISDFRSTVDAELLNYVQKTGLEPQYIEAEYDMPGTEQK